MHSLAALAASDNAAWCAAVWRTHEIEADLGTEAWTSRVRTPPLYPDAVTLVADLSVPALLARIDDSPGCSVKDSFASLDLTGHGFRVLFDAQWIVRHPSGAPPVVPAGPPWTAVADADGFAAWEAAWRGPSGPPDVLRADLLRAPGVTLLAAYADGGIAGGAILHAGSSALTGISNLFCAGVGMADAWQGCLAAATALHPDATLVGYETGEELDVASRLGFEVAGPLRVWLRD